MKKIYLLITLIFMFPVIVSADECTDEQLKSYKTYVNSVKYDVRQLGDSDTYEVWASNVTGGLALDHGRIVFDNGFLGYATAGEKFTVRVYVADGSSCAGTTISNVDVKIPDPIEEEVDDCDSCEEETTPPTVVEKPSTNTEVEKPSTNTETQKPTTDNSTTIQKPTVDDSTNVEEKPNTNDSTTVEKPSTDIDNSETNTDIPSDDDSDVNNSLEDETTDIPNTDDTQENKNDDNVKDVDVADDNKIRDALIFAGVSILFIILVLIYNLKRKRILK